MDTNEIRARLTQIESKLDIVIEMLEQEEEEYQDMLDNEINESGLSNDGKEKGTKEKEFIE